MCGKETHVNPPTKPVLDENNQVIMTTMKIQDPFSGDVKSAVVPKVEDLYPRTHIIRVSAGQEVIQKDFCKECLDKVRPELEALWNKLESIEDK